MREFFMNWQDPETRRWLPVAKLISVDGYYIFGYTEGARVSENFKPFGSMNDLSSLYVSDELFPIFANRVMNEKRPEYRRYMDWADLGLSSDPLSLMARVGGVRATDQLQVFPVPERTLEGKYRTVFFLHGISHMPPESVARIAGLTKGDNLFPMLDVQNPFDHNAVCLRTADPAMILGYCPRYIAPDLRVLAEDQSAFVSVTVKKVNLDAPAQFRLLCEAVCTWPEHFVPCSSNEHILINPLSIDKVLDSLNSSMVFDRTLGKTYA
ncbi:hypothetical protein ASD74_13185 [Rhizobium sp. Root564]|uniref:hypothetical protein n=1 Tax=Agrobacterium cavarae TaxID=2528239 RepID=UPI000713C02D|nr:hypothetical protein [Agrobacterium cavarae]KQZ95741.1 hypothetical protein ASD74_13185 [Rhizobium sp. Root564]